jgi:hypothetical protein
MSRYHHKRRVDLFLVRVWQEESERGEEGSDEEVEEEWNGSVQRVVDGETRRFNSWQDLAELMLAMVSEKIGR